MSATIVFTKRFRQAWKQLPFHTRKIVQNKIRQLAENPMYPSLQSHRLRQANTENMWVAYISVNQRLLYQHKGETIYLFDVGEHSVVERVRQRNFDL